MNLTRGKQNRIAVIHGNDGSDVRIGKVCRSLSRNGFEVAFIGWNRRTDETAAVELGSTKTLVMQFGTKHGRATILGQLYFVWHILRMVWRFQPRVVCAVNEDLALFLLPFKRVLFRRLVCDIFDTFYDRHSHRNWVTRSFARVVTWMSRTFSDRLIVTDANRLQRLGKKKAKAIIVNNYPEDPGQEIAANIPQGAAKLFVGGSLNKRRGVNQAIAAVEGTEVEIISVGWIYDEDAERFKSHPKVDYRGIVTLADALKFASECDAVFSYYEPSSQNNLNASPNKIYDALSVGRPTVVNSEIGISRWVADEQIGFVCDYEDVDTLRDNLKRLRANRPSLPDFSRKARELFERGYSWSVMEEKLIKFYRELFE